MASRCGLQPERALAWRLDDQLETYHRTVPRPRRARRRRRSSPSCGGDDGETLTVYSGPPLRHRDGVRDVVGGGRRRRRVPHRQRRRAARAHRRRGRGHRGRRLPDRRRRQPVGGRRGGHLPAARTRRSSTSPSRRSCATSRTGGSASPCAPARSSTTPTSSTRPTCRRRTRSWPSEEYDGRICLRNANNDYQQSLVASMIAADGEDATVEVLRGWASNAEVYANDVALLDAMAAGACEIGVVNHYYLARLLEEDPDAPIGLLWAEQDGRGVHINISGGGVTRYADDVDARPAVPRVAGDRRSGHPRRRQPRVPGEPGRRGRAADPRDVRHRLRPRPAARRRPRLAQR